MLEKKDHVKRIQEITFEAYKSSGRIAALLDQNTGPSEQLSEELERVAAQIEHGAIELRNLCARYQAPLPPVGQKPALEPLNIAGRAECNEFGWLHIQLNALLPNCRFASPLWITDTITRLLDRLERRNGKLPLLEEALLMIDEHCDIAARQVYDQDNKAWKAISNALKGRVVADDDQPRRFGRGKVVVAFGRNGDLDVAESLRRRDCEPLSAAVVFDVRFPPDVGGDRDPSAFGLAVERQAFVVDADGGPGGFAAVYVGVRTCARNEQRSEHRT